MPFTPMHRVRSVYRGITGSPFLQTLYFDTFTGSAQSVVTELEASYAAMSGLVSDLVTITVESEVETVDPATGQVTGVEQVSVTPQSMSASSGPLPQGTNGYAILNTGVWRNGRQVRGRFYLPAPTEVDNAGTGLPAVTYNDSLLANLSALVQQANVNMIVYSRTQGEWFEITGFGRATGWARLSTRRT